MTHQETPLHDRDHNSDRVIPGHTYGTLVPRFYMPPMRKRVGGWRAGCRRCHAPVIVTTSQLLSGRCPACLKSN